MISNKLYQKLSKEAQNVAEYIYNIYRNDDVCIGEVLDVLTTTDIPDSESLTIEDWHYVYMSLMSYVEGDRFFRSINDDEPQDYETSHN